MLTEPPTDELGKAKSSVVNILRQPGDSAEGSSLAQLETYWNGIDASEIVDWSADYIVYVNRSVNELDWNTSDEYDEATKANSDNLAAQNLILAEAALLESRVKSEDAIGDVASEWFRYFIGRAIVSTFERDYSGAKQVLSKATQYFRARSEETSRRWYVVGSFTFTLPFVVLGACVWYFRIWIIAELGDTLFWLLLCLMAGALGALLSVIARSGKLEFDSSAGKFLHYLESASRITMGALSGSIVGLAVKSGLFLGGPIPGGAPGSSKNAIMILAAFAAGASERLLGSIISKFDPNVRSDQTNRHSHSATTPASN